MPDQNDNQAPANTPDTDNVYQPFTPDQTESTVPDEPQPEQITVPPTEVPVVPQDQEQPTNPFGEPAPSELTPDPEPPIAPVQPEPTYTAPMAQQQAPEPVAAPVVAPEQVQPTTNFSEQPPVVPVVPVSPFGQPATVVPAPAAPSPAPTPKAKKKWLAPVIALVVALLLAGGASAYYFVIYQKPQNVVRDALGQLLSAKAVQTNSVLTLNQKLDSAITLKDIKLTTETANKNAGLLDATVDMDYSGKAFSVGGKVMLSLQDSVLYFQLNNLKQALSTVAEAQGVSNSALDSFLSGLGTLQDQWVKVTLADVKSSDQTTGTMMQCEVDALKKHMNDNSSAIADAYQKNPFITVKQDLGLKNGNQGYVLGWNEANAKAFGTAVRGTPAYKDLNACDSSLSNSSTTPSTGTGTTNATYTVWISQWTHQLQQLDLNMDTTAGSTTTNITGTMNFAYDSKTTVATPGNSIPLSEFYNRYNNVASGLGMPDSTSLQNQYSTGASFNITNSL